jgi:hypothetical protein
MWQYSNVFPSINMFLEEVSIVAHQYSVTHATLC